MPGPYQKLTPPTAGHIIRLGKYGSLEVPDDPIIPFIEGDGTGPDIWRASQLVFDAAVEKAYRGKRRLCWFEGVRRREGQPGVWRGDLAA